MSTAVVGCQEVCVGYTTWEVEANIRLFHKIHDNTGIKSLVELVGYNDVE